MSSRRVTIILNTAAGRAKDDALSERLLTVFEKSGIRVNIHRVEGGQGIENIVAEAASFSRRTSRGAEFPTPPGALD